MKQTLIIFRMIFIRTMDTIENPMQIMEYLAEKNN